MSLTKHYYKNDEITVVWEPGICQHSAKCFHGLPAVFDPRRKPWIEMDKDDTNTIIEQVKKCPSGALSFFINSEKPENL